jgi:hypothetical protein
MFRLIFYHHQANKNCYETVTVVSFRDLVRYLTLTIILFYSFITGIQIQLNLSETVQKLF